MFALSPATKIYLAAGATDLRLGFEGLASMAQTVLDNDPFSGHIFLFSNRTRTRVKALYFDGSGLWCCTKRLEKGRYSWPQPGPEGQRRLQLSGEELMLLIGGIDLTQTKKKDWWRRDGV